MFCQVVCQHHSNLYKLSVLFIQQANSTDQDQMLHDAVSDQGLHCLLTLNVLKNLNKADRHHPTTLKVEIDLSN